MFSLDPESQFSSVVFLVCAFDTRVVVVVGDRVPVAY